MSSKVLICCTGSVATIKICDLIDNLRSLGVNEIKVVFTSNAFRFASRTEIFEKNVDVLCDDDEWNSWSGRGDPVLHIELRKWADLAIIAPLDANTLAKISQGLCDNLLTCIIRAWDFAKPLLFCPAMNTIMWKHPITAIQVAQLKNWGFIEVPCISKTLMCNDIGLGAMAESKVIAETALQHLKNRS